LPVIADSLARDRGWPGWPPRWADPAYRLGMQGIH